MFADHKVAGMGISLINKKNLTNKHGPEITNVFQLADTMAKIKQTNLDRYGTENPSSNEQVKQKRINTMLERYDVAHNFVGWEDKIEAKYGVRNAAHIPDIAEKLCNNRFKKRHPYVLSDETIIYLQGYEPYGFSHLKKLYLESEILYKKRDMPTIWYEYEGKTHRYYPDFAISNTTLVIEIKSPYTYARDFPRVQAKIQATNNTGHTLLLLVFEKNGQLLLEQEHKPDL